jgi:beta-xylosidase
MVAIPTYMLASAAMSHLEARAPLPAVASQDSADFYGSVIGPVVGGNFPDPALLYEDGITYAYSTNSAGVHIPMATSSDNTTWTLLAGHDALPSLAPWETDNKVWAPDVIRLSSTSYLMYYASGTQASDGQYHCIGVATSSSPSGPFTPSTQPLICPDGPSTGGAIDPDAFIDPATNNLYLTYKLDGNALGNGGACNNGIAPIHSTPIMLQPLSADGLSLAGNPTQILDRDESDGPLVEAPSLYLSPEGVYFLFFASGCYSSPTYATSYATSRSIAGPYTKAARPLLITGDGAGIVGPGGLDVVSGGDGRLVAFHGIVSGAPSRLRSRGPAPLVRAMYAAQLVTSGDEVSFQLSAPS